MSEKIRVITEDQYKEYMKLKKQFVDSTKNVRWKPKEGEPYWHIYDDGTIDYDFWTSENDILLGRYKLGNCFETEGEAQKELDRRIAERKLLDMMDAKMSDDGDKFYIEYDPRGEVFYPNQTVYRFATPILFSSAEYCNEVIGVIGEEKLKLIFRID